MWTYRILYRKPSVHSNVSKLEKNEGQCKILSKLRREARLKRYISPVKRNLHLPLDDTVSTFTPSSPIGTNDNNRWYRNDLSKTLIEINNDNGTTTPIKDKDDMKVQKTHKSVMKQLLGVNSPPSPKKYHCFKNMNVNDNAAHTIIELSIEMGSTIEDVKNMILNNCAD